MKEIKREFNEVWNLAEKTNFNQAILVSLEEEIVPDTMQWESLDYLQHEYHYNYNQELVIDNSMRYTQKDIEEYGEEKVLEWIQNDEKRLNKFKNQQLWLNGIRVKAVIAIPSKRNKSYKNTTIKSAGLWGIPSDSSQEYLKEVKNEELHSLLKELKMLNVAGLEEVDIK